MPKYLMEGKYAADGAKGLAAEGGTSRRKAVEEMIKGMNGSLEAFYYAFGETDVFLIVDLPDAITAAALSLVVNGSGAVTLTGHALFTAEEMDQAAKKSVAYRAPGK